MVSVFACFIAIRYQIRFSRSTILFSLVISFPLLFSIQEAFKRREKALEYLSSFKAAMQATLQSFYLVKKIKAADNAEIRNLLEDLSSSVLLYLECRNPDSVKLYEKFQDVFLFMFIHRSEISTSVNMRISRHLENAYTSVVYLVSLTTHGTMIVVRRISYIFINLFPIIQAPVLFEVFGRSFPIWVIYLISLLSSLLLIVFYTIQEQMENPFDQIGLDDIRLTEFKLTVTNLPLIENKDPEMENKLTNVDVEITKTLNE